MAYPRSARLLMIRPIIFIPYRSLFLPSKNDHFGGTRVPHWVPIEFPLSSHQDVQVLDLLLQKLDVSFSPRKHDLSMTLSTAEKIGWSNWSNVGCSSPKKKGTVLENIICAKVKTWNIGLRVIHYSTYWESFQCINPSSLFMTIPNMIQDWTVLIRYNCSRALRSSGVCCFKDSSECQSFDRLQLLTYDEGIV